MECQSIYKIIKKNTSSNNINICFHQMSLQELPSPICKFTLSSMPRILVFVTQMSHSIFNQQVHITLFKIKELIISV